MLWGIQVAAVVVGHVIGAWAGHAAIRHSVARAPQKGEAKQGAPAEAALPSQLPLALLMIVLTSATLWSLGQNIVFAEPAA